MLAVICRNNVLEIVFSDKFARVSNDNKMALNATRPKVPIYMYNFTACRPQI